MNFGDHRHGCKSEFSKRLTEELRTLTAHEDAFNPEDMGLIFDIQYLMLAFDCLNKSDLIRGTPKVSEAETWLARFKDNFQAWSEYEDYPGLLQAFEQFVNVCEDNN